MEWWANNLRHQRSLSAFFISSLPTSFAKTIDYSTLQSRCLDFSITSVNIFSHLWEIWETFLREFLKRTHERVRHIHIHRFCETIYHQSMNFVISFRVCFLYVIFVNHWNDLFSLFIKWKGFNERGFFPCS